MPYKIHTYEDPYQLDKADFWDEIRGLPHFCVARTLVNGLKDVMRDSIDGLLCPLDDMVSHENIYKSWTDDIGRRIQQYSVLTSIFSKYVDDAVFLSALTHNQPQFLDAIRLFLELGVTAKSLDKQQANREQRLFIQVLADIQSSQDTLFQFPITPNLAVLKEVIETLAEKELSDFENRNEGRDSFYTKQDVDWYKKMVVNTKHQPLTAIVVHGLHQFSPAQLRLLIDLEQMGVTIIFLFNYQKKYKGIYSSWRYIYDCFDTPIQADTCVNVPILPALAMQNPSNALAMALGELCEGRGLHGNQGYRTWHRLYKDTPFREFANITEYAHNVSDHFELAKTRYKESQGIIEQGNGVWNNAAVLRLMDEQVYTANRDVHTLLKIYYPEYAKERHFLAYPIGQFFSAIYQLWDYERKEINMDVGALKECLASNVLSSGQGEELLRTYYNLQIIFENCASFTDFKTAIKQTFMAQYKKVVECKGTDPLVPLKQLSIYNKYNVQKKDIDALLSAIEEINAIAISLFSQDHSHDEFINFGKHFEHLEGFLKKRQLDWANEEERSLIMALQLRLDKIKPERSTFSGTFRDLRQGLHFYLKQKDDDNGVDWIVKNFEQIDGDILQSKGQYERQEKKTYHFACLSQRDFSCRVDELLPWPLSDNFIRRAYTPIDLQFQIYYRALGERGSFLRYALFYGLFFNCCDVKLSYVKQYGDDQTEPYALFSVLGLKTVSGVVESAQVDMPFGLNIPQQRTAGVAYNRNEMMSMFLCPYRFLLDYVLSDAPIVQGDFLYQKFYENLLIEGAWKQLEKKPQDMALQQLDGTLSAINNFYKPYFSFWKDTELYDLVSRARNYIIYNLVDGTTVRNFAPSHMAMRAQYGNARFDINILIREPKNPYTAFEQLAKRNGMQKSYSLYSVPKEKQNTPDTPQIQSLRTEMKQYLNQTKADENTEIPSEWCTYCTHRGVCMKSFLLTE